MIEIKNLTMRYKNGKGVGDINISVDNGEVKGLLGPNGAGKSTTMRSLMGFLIPSDGSLTVEGINTIENPVEAKKIIGYLPGDPQLPLDYFVVINSWFVVKMSFNSKYLS